ncbi:MAG: DUF1501 domain-containing protein [Alphaproteobacteria bacterium]|nr:DUF1501 domain-containing protein [Alphaproteobacteria bacterium]MCB9696062.1 DUF1501 domain-containing protein [Alphaproteobacteria bacterium]
MLTRRQALFGGAALGAGLLAPRPVRASVAPKDRKFLFVLAKGGWDVTRVFAPVFAPTVTRDAGDEPARAGNLVYVANRQRPNVDRFLDTMRDRVSTIDGLLVRSVNHRTCRRLWLSNSTDPGAVDWPTRIGADAADRYAVPHIVSGDKALAGDDAWLTGLVGVRDEVSDLLDGAAIAKADVPTALPPAAVESLVDAYAQAAVRRVHARSDEEERLLRGWRESQERLIDFQRRGSALDLSSEGDLTGRISQVGAYLGSGLCRCASMILPYFYDTHYDDPTQSRTLDNTFAAMTLIDRMLRTTPGTNAPTLADETVVVVYSEMGRTPYVTVADGREHWMFTSCITWGPGVRGGRQFGGYDDDLVGLGVDLASGETDPSHGVQLTPDVVGSTLLRLAGMDPASALGADTSLTALLEDT